MLKLNQETTYLTDEVADSTILAYKNGDSSASVGYVHEVCSKVFFTKIKPYRSFTWYSQAQEDIKAEFNLWFYDAVEKFEPAKLSFLPYIYTNLDNLVNTLYYKYSQNNTNLDRTLQTIKTLALKFVDLDPSLKLLAPLEFKTALRELIIQEKAVYFTNKGISIEQALDKAGDNFVSAGFEAALPYVFELIHHTSITSINYEQELNPNFDLPDNHTSVDPKFELLLSMALGAEQWAVPFYLQYLGLEGDANLSKETLLKDTSFSKAELSKVINLSESRLTNPLVHFAYLEKFTLETESGLLNSVSPVAFSDF